MFVNKLEREQVIEFVREYLKEDFHPEVPSKTQVNLTFYNNEEVREVHYCSKTFNRHISVYLMDDRMVPFISRELENDWLNYLDKTFEGEYKKWYLAERAKVFEQN